MADMRLINANDIPWRLGCNDDGRTIVYARATDVDAMPTIDAVPVVRCKDCRYMEVDCGVRYGVCNGARFCRVWGTYNGMGDEGFCNYGKRKDDGA